MKWTEKPISAKWNLHAFFESESPTTKSTISNIDIIIDLIAMGNQIQKDIPRIHSILTGGSCTQS